MTSKMPTERQLGVLQAMKQAGSGREAAIKVFSRAGDLIGNLVPITLDLANSSTVSEMLCRWREVYNTMFLTVFKATPERTKDFLIGLLLPDPARLLFLITDELFLPIGNIGVCHLTPDTVELDNIIRGEEVKIANFMYFVEATLINWIFGQLGVESIYLHVLSINKRAIALYKRVGFRISDSISLLKQDTADGYRLMPIPGGSGSEGVPNLIKMTISREAFYEQNAWVIQIRNELRLPD